MLHLPDDIDNYILQLDGVPMWSANARDYLNKHLPHRGIGRVTDYKMLFTQWPPRSPNLTLNDFFLWSEYNSIRENVEEKGVEKLQSSFAGLSTISLPGKDRIRDGIYTQNRYRGVAISSQMIWSQCGERVLLSRIGEVPGSLHLVESP
ncbi:hypothetical protein TNCV_1577461 [Trichonephila clavipes]|nr:hypothetical protein TNCV_1577461 [Trichonephila clavipes]